MSGLSVAILRDFRDSARIPPAGSRRGPQERRERAGHRLPLEIDRPDSVSRVAPPTITMIAIRAATKNQPPSDGAVWLVPHMRKYRSLHPSSNRVPQALWQHLDCIAAPLIVCSPRAQPGPGVSHIRHDHPHPQILRHHLPARAGRGLVLAGHDDCADAVAGQFGAAAGNLLRGGRYWAGCCRRCRSSAGCHGRMPQKITHPNCPFHFVARTGEKSPRTGSRASCAAIAAGRPRRHGAAPADWCSPWPRPRPA